MLPTCLIRAPNGHPAGWRDRRGMQTLDPPCKLSSGTAISSPKNQCPVAYTRPESWPSRVLGLTSEPPLARPAVGIMACDCTIRIDKAQRELGYEPIISREKGLSQLRGLSE